MTHLLSSRLTPKWAMIWGTATLTMLESRIDMKVPIITIPITDHL